MAWSRSPTTTRRGMTVIVDSVVVRYWIGKHLRERTPRRQYACQMHAETLRKESARCCMQPNLLRCVRNTQLFAFSPLLARSRNRSRPKLLVDLGSSGCFEVRARLLPSARYFCCGPRLCKNSCLGFA